MFVIVGLLLLLGVIIATTVFSDFLSFRPPEEQVTSELDTELQPLAFSVRECQEQLLSAAAHQVLRGGGYLQENAAHLNTILAPSNNAVQLQRTIPYWRYVDRGTEATQKPPLQGPQSLSVATQIASYVDQRLTDCVDWSNYPQYEITSNQPRSSVTFSNDETRINTFWAVTVETHLGVKEYQGFQAEVDAPVQRLYRLAEEVVDITRSSKLIENRVLDWLSIYAGLSNLPPIAGTTELTRSFQVYSIASAREEFDLVLARALNYIQLHTTADTTLIFYEDESLNILQINSIIPQTQYTTPDTSFRAYNPTTDHPSTQTHFLINGQRGVAMPQITRFGGGLIGSVLPPLVDNRYSYQATFPAVYEFTHNGYTMQVAYQANIDNNQPSTAQTSTTNEDTGLCEDLGGAQLHLTVTPSIPASATYTCGGITCGLGEVIDGELQTTLPTCASGELEVFALNRFAEQKTISSSSDETIPLTVELFAPRPVEVSVQARRLTVVPVIEGTNFELVPTLSPALTDYDVDIFFLRQGMPFAAGMNTAQGDTTVQLIPGTYDVYAMHISDEKHVIEEETRREGRVWGGIISRGETITLEEIELEATPLAYLELKGDQGVRITPTTNQLNLTVPRITYDQLNKHEDLELLGILTDFGVNMPDAWTTS